MNLSASSKRFYTIPVMATVLLVLGACADTSDMANNGSDALIDDGRTGSLTAGDIAAEPASSASIVASATAADSRYRTIEWIDLMPKEDFDALTNPPEYLNEIEDGAPEDMIGSGLKNNLPGGVTEDRYQQALVSQRIVEEMNDQAVRIPGFIVPLESDEEQNVTEFFLVPFFGACIHVPPPPPNQIIFVKYDKGIKVDSIYNPFWISGDLKTSLTENDLAISAYTIQAAQVEIYQY